MMTEKLTGQTESSDTLGAGIQQIVQEAVKNAMVGVARDIQALGDELKTSLRDELRATLRDEIKKDRKKAKRELDAKFAELDSKFDESDKRLAKKFDATLDRNRDDVKRLIDNLGSRAGSGYDAPRRVPLGQREMEWGTSLIPKGGSWSSRRASFTD